MQKNCLFLLQTELLIQAQLTRELATLSPSLQGDFRRILEMAPRLLEELMKVTLLTNFSLCFITPAFHFKSELSSLIII